MKSPILVLAWVGLTFAQAPHVDDYLPACAVPCFGNAIKSATSCNLEDPKCQCEATNIAAIAAIAVPCSVGACGQDVVTADVLPGAQKYCASAIAAAANNSTTTATTTSVPGVSTTLPESNTTSTSSTSSPSSTYVVANDATVTIRAGVLGITIAAGLSALAML